MHGSELEEEAGKFCRRGSNCPLRRPAGTAGKPYFIRLFALARRLLIGIVNEPIGSGHASKRRS